VKEIRKTISLLKTIRRMEEQAYDVYCSLDDHMKVHEILDDLKESSKCAPFLGRLFLCLFLPPEKHADRLGDFDEMLNTVWLPQFGPRLGRLIYIWHALRSAGAIIRIGITATVVDRIVRAIWR
jgi:hypothetical protein